MYDDNRAAYAAEIRDQNEAFAASVEAHRNTVGDGRVLDEYGWPAARSTRQTEGANGTSGNDGRPA